MLNAEVLFKKTQKTKVNKIFYLHQNILWKQNKTKTHVMYVLLG